MSKWLFLCLLGSVLYAFPKAHALESDVSCRLFIQVRPGVKFDSEFWKKNFRVLKTELITENTKFPPLESNTGVVQITSENRDGFEFYWQENQADPLLHLDRAHFQKAFQTEYPTCGQLRKISAQFQPRQLQSQAALDLLKNGSSKDFIWGHFFLSLENSVYFRTGYWVDSRPLYDRYDKNLAYYREQLKKAPQDFLPKLNFLTDLIFKNEKLKNYCPTSYTMSAAYLFNCTSCQGQTWIYLSVLRDLNITIPAPYELGVQFFKGHVRPVLWDQSGQRVKDLVYGGGWEIHTKEPVYKPELLLQTFVQSSDSGLSPSQINEQEKVYPGCYLIHSPYKKIHYNFFSCNAWVKDWFKTKSAKAHYGADSIYASLSKGQIAKTHIEFPQASALKNQQLARQDFSDQEIDMTNARPYQESEEMGESNLDINKDQLAIYDNLVAHREELSKEDRKLIDEIASAPLEYSISVLVTADELLKTLPTTKKHTPFLKSKEKPSEFSIRFAKLKERLSVDSYLRVVGQERRMGDTSAMITPVISFNTLPNVPEREAYRHRWKSMSLIDRTITYEKLLEQKLENLFVTDEFRKLRRMLTSRIEEVEYTTDQVRSAQDLLQEIQDRISIIRTFVGLHLADAVEWRNDGRIRELNSLVVIYAKNLGEQHREFLKKASKWNDVETMRFFKFTEALTSLTQWYNESLPVERVGPIGTAKNDFTFKMLSIYPLTSLFEQMLTDPDFVYTTKKNVREMEQIARLKADYTVLERWSPAVDVQPPAIPIPGENPCKNKASGFHNWKGLIVECKPTSQTATNGKIVLRMPKILPADLLVGIFLAQADEFLLYPPNQLLMAMSWSEELENQVPREEIRRLKHKVFYPSAFLIPGNGSYSKVDFSDAEVSDAPYTNARDLEKWMDGFMPGYTEPEFPRFWESSALLRTGYQLWIEQEKSFKHQKFSPVLTMVYGLATINFSDGGAGGMGMSSPRSERMRWGDKMWVFDGNLPDNSDDANNVSNPPTRARGG